MKDGELDKLIQQDHEALAAFCLGDPEPKKRLYSHSDDVTLANRWDRRRVDGRRSPQ
jgi:hypothetical protein